MADCPDPEVYRGRVGPEWIDTNGHMNVAWYVLAFDYGIDGLWHALDLTDQRREETGSSTFAVESHVCYVRELFEGQPFVVTSRLLAWDAKRLHQLQRLFHAEDGWLAATCEWLHLHIDLGTRRVAPWPAEVLQQFAEHDAAGVGGPWPAEVGRVIGISEPLGPDPKRMTGGQRHG
jgi:acyl-CoA thioester hydrolase